MKKYIFLLICLLGAGALRAQTIVGDLSVTRKELCRQDGKLVLKLDVHVSRRAVTRSQSWLIIPELSTPDRRSVKLFPHILIDGPYQRHMRERRRVLCGAHWAEREPQVTIDVRRKTDRTISYAMEVPYEEWMERATLVLRQIQTSPGRRNRVFTVDVNGAVDVEK